MSSVLITSTEVKSYVTPVTALDPAFYDKSIDYVEEFLIKPILTSALYADLVANLGNYTALLPYVKEAMAWGIAYEAYRKDLERQVNNQGVMQNNTQYSNQTDEVSTRRTLANYKEREFMYMKKLGQYLIDNASTYPLFDIDEISYEPSLSRFFPV